MSVEGMSGDDYTFPVDSSKVREFAKAVDDPHGPDHVPVTFPAYAASAYETLDVLSAAGLNLKRVLHGEQEYTYERPLQVGDRLVCRSTIVSDETKTGKRGGTMRVIVLETRMHDAESDDLVATSRATVLELGGGDDN